jgi:hypothetical protein
VAISYPLALPATRGFRRLALMPMSVVGVQAAPLTGGQTVYAWPGEWWEGEFELGSMNREDGEPWAAFVAALNGREGTFLAGDPLGAAPRGTWAGAPKVLGAHAAGVKTIAMDGFSAAATVKAGDWFQQGTGALSRLHKIVQDGTADGGGLLTIEIWPRTRVALIDNETFVTAGAKGVWRLNNNRRGWSIEDVRIGGISLPIIEAV